MKGIVLICGMLLSGTIFAAPANDNFVNAASISGGFGSSAVVDTMSATAETNEPAHAEDVASHSVWWSYVALADGVLTLDTLQSAESFDTVLAVYTGSTLSTLTEVSSNDDDDGDEYSRSKLGFGITQGEMYWIAVDGYEGATGDAILSWSLAQGAAPDNDDFEDALLISDLLGTSATIDTIFATIEPDEPEHTGSTSGHSVWWTYTATNDSLMVLDTLRSSFDTVLAVYTGNILSNLMEVAFNDDEAESDRSKLSFIAYDNETYWIAVDGYDGSTGNAILNWDITPGEIPTNDNFTNSTVITSLSGASIPINTLLAGTELDEPLHAGSESFHSIWWTYAALGDGVMVLDTLQSDAGFDTVLGVYTGSALSNLTEVASNDDFNGGTLQSKLAVAIHTDETVWIAVDGVEESTGEAILRWRIVLGDAPANDNFTNATSISGSSGASTAIETALATAELNEPAHAGNGSFHSIWWTYTAPSSGVMVLDTLQSNGEFNTLLAVYTGSALGGLMEVASNDDAMNETGARSKLTMMVLSGETYQVAVDGGAGDTGEAVLRWEVSINADDDDDDGVGNADEVIADTNPNDSNEWFRITGMEGSTVYFDSSSAREYALYWSTNLVENSWVPVAQERVGVDGPDSLSRPNPTSKEFYKVGVALPVENGSGAQ